MRHVTSLILGISAGIAGYAGVIHLLIGVARRPRDRTHLIFGLLSLAVAVHTLVVLALHTAPSTAAYVAILKYWFGPTSCASIVALTWFVAYYTGVRPRRFLLGMSLWFGLIVVIHLGLPSGILYAEVGGLRRISLPWGESIVVARGAPHPWRPILDLFFLTMFAFFFTALLQQYRHRSRRDALVLGLALALFLVARVVDTLQVIGAIDTIYTSQFAFLGIVIAMSLVLSHGITQTEIELHTYQEHLHDMVAARTADNTRLYQRVVAARERLTILYQASQAMSRASLDPEQVYAEIHTATARLMPTEAFVIALFDTARQGVDYVYLADKDGRRPGGRYPLAHTFAASMLGRDAPLRSDDVSAFPQSEFAFELFGDLPGTQSGVAVLLRGSERLLGLVFVRSYARGAYSDEDQEALELLATQAAIALENAWRYRQAGELATSEERTRLARELHDAVTQTLYSASLVAEVLPLVWKRNVAEGERNLAVLRQLVRGALAEMRTLLFELRPAALVAADLGSLLRQLGDVLTSHTSIPVELTIDGAARLPADIHIAVYRIAQEAFNNIAKHAGATLVGVTFRAAPDGLFLAVRDDGRGFDPTAIPDDHMGVRIMAERAAGIGARLRIDSAPWRGTEVSVRWPDPSG